MGQDSRGVMDDHLIKQLIKLDAVIKPSQREFDSRLWNIYVGIIVLFIPFLLFLLFMVANAV